MDGHRPRATQRHLPRLENHQTWARLTAVALGDPGPWFEVRHGTDDTTDPPGLPRNPARDRSYEPHKRLTGFPWERLVNSLPRQQQPLWKEPR